MCAKHGGCCCRWNVASSSIPSSPQGNQYPSRQWPHRRKPQATDVQMKHFWPSKNRIWERQNISRKPSRRDVKNQKGLSVSWGWGSTTGSWGQSRRNTREGNISQSFWGLVSDRAVLFGFGCLFIVIKEVLGCVPVSPMSAESYKAILLLAGWQILPTSPLQLGTQRAPFLSYLNLYSFFKADTFHIFFASSCLDRISPPFILFLRACI